MNYLDVRISELIDETEAHLLRSSQPYGFQGYLRMMLKSRLRIVVRVVMILVVLFLAGAIWAAIGFYEATDTLAAVKYGVTASTLVILAAVLQIGLAPQMQAERLIRALKRIEILLMSHPR